MSAQKKLQQENFEIQQGDSQRRKIVRQDRIFVEAKTLYVSVKNSEYEVLNISPFGVAFLANAKDMESFKALKGDVIRECPLSLKNFVFQDVAIRPVRFEQHPVSGEWIIGCEVLDEPVRFEHFQAIQQGMGVVESLATHVKLQQKIPNSVKLGVYEMRAFLETMKQNIMDLEKKVPVDNSRTNSDHRDSIALVIADYLGQMMPLFYQKIPPMLASLDETTKQDCLKFAREELGSYIYGAPFAHRAFYKPRGYAGDYEMMNQLYRDNLAGRSLYDQAMHRYLIDEPAAEAVKNRGRYLLSKFVDLCKNSKKTNLKILSVASGPALEVQLFLTEYAKKFDKHIEFHFIDQDEEALKHAQKQILSIDRFVQSGYTFSFQNLAIKNLLNHGIPNNGFDLIYSAGLFDYFTDPVATAAGKTFYAALAEGGSTVIGNFSKDNPTAPLMEMILEWHLIYRNNEDLVRIFQPLNGKVEIEFEPLKINLFAVIRK